MNVANSAMEKAKAAANGTPALKQGESLPALLKKDDVRKRFEEVLGKKSAGFISSILTLATTNQNFSDVNPRSILSSAMIAATLDLPINSNLGFAHIVPYSGVAQFQMGWRGFVQLAIRTGQYKTINAALVYEGELKSYNRFTGEIELDPNAKTTDKVIGFYSFFRLVNGFEKCLYMTTDEIRAHGQKFSKSFSNPKGRWALDFNSMGLKTVVKLLLGKWGILSIELQRAMVVDQAVVKDDANIETVEYIDRPEPEAEGETEIPEAKPKISAVDVKIHEAKAKLAALMPTKEGKHTAGEVFYYDTLGNDFGYAHMTELPEGKKEMFLSVLDAKIKTLENDKRRREA